VVKRNVSGSLHYLVTGMGGSPCWAFSCHGRKIEKVMQNRRAGKRTVVVSEHDFWAAVESLHA
jgi:hypothetical protein